MFSAEGMVINMNIRKRIFSLIGALLLVSALTVTAFADEITPHEDTDEYYEEDYTYTDEGDVGTTEPENPIQESSADETPTEQSNDTNKVESNSKTESSTAATVGNDTTSTIGGEAEEEKYVVFGKLSSKSNDIGSVMNMIGIGCIALGAVGIICVIVWSAATKDIKKKSDDNIYKTVGEAQRNEVRERPVQRRNPYDYNDNYNDPRPRQQQQRPSQPRQAAPQPRQRIDVQDPRGAAPQPRQAQQVRQQPVPQSRPVQQTRQQPAPKPSSKRNNFDTDEILSELLGNRNK